MRACTMAPTYIWHGSIVTDSVAPVSRLFEKDRFHRIDIPPNVDLVRVGSAIGYRF